MSLGFDNYKCDLIQELPCLIHLLSYDHDLQIYGIRISKKTVCVTLTTLYMLHTLKRAVSNEYCLITLNKNLGQNDGFMIDINKPIKIEVCRLNLFQGTNGFLVCK